LISISVFIASLAFPTAPPGDFLSPVLLAARIVG